MNEIRGWDYDYLNYVSNKDVIKSFLEENNSIILLKRAIEILKNHSDIMSFGFIAARAIALDESGRNFRNPLFSIWGQLRQRAISVLQTPPMKDPLDYLFMDYKLALWILSITKVPQDLDLCLEVYENYGEQHFMLKSSVKSTIYELVDVVYITEQSTQLKYNQFLKKELAAYPINNIREIKGLLTFAGKADWEYYISDIKQGKVENNKLGASILFYLLQSSNSVVRNEILNCVELFTKNEQQSNDLYFFYKKAKDDELNILNEQVDKHKELKLSIEKRDIKRFSRLLSTDFSILKNVLLTKSTYQNYGQSTTYHILPHLATYLFENETALSSYLSYFSLLRKLSNHWENSNLENFMKEKLTEAEPWINKYHYQQQFIFNSEDFKQLLEESNLI